MEQDQLSVYLSDKDACYGSKQWDIRGASTVALASRVGRRPSGIRHRLPIELRSTDGSTMLTVKRSRALKAMAARYQLVAPNGDLLGTVERKQAKQANLHQRLLDAQGRLLGVLRRVDTGDAGARHSRYEDCANESLQGLALAQTVRGRRQPYTWSVKGLRSVSDETRLLVVAHQLIIEPWAAGENATDKTQRDDHY